MKNGAVKKHFDIIALNYDSGKKIYSFYYTNLKKLLRSIIPPNKKVFEVGCGTGDLLVSLKPEKGYGMDISGKMIQIAKKKHKDREGIVFSTRWPEKKYDFIFMSDVIEHLEDPEKEFKKIYQLMDSDAKFINTMANPIWEPLLMLWEKMGWKMEEGKHKRIKYEEIKKMLERSGLRIIRHDYRLLIPVQIPVLTNIANKYFEKLFRKYAFIEYFEAKKLKSRHKLFKS